MPRGQAEVWWLFPRPVFDVVEGLECREWDSGARILRMEGRLGVVAAGAFADLLVVDGDPLADISVLGGQGERLALIMKQGRLVKNALSA